jgi:Ca2+-binding RTX toxin-like protein
MGSDTVAGGPENDTANGTAATLNAGDSLTGGAGTDVLALIGSGTFRVDQLATFTGFERIRLDNATTSYANLMLGS